MNEVPIFTDYQRWACCGPDFTDWVRRGVIEQPAALRTLFQQLGEIRVRYAGLLIEGLGLAGQEGITETLMAACRDRWMAPTSLRSLSGVLSGQQAFPEIPWVDRYVRNVRPGMARIISGAAEMACYLSPAESVLAAHIEGTPQDNERTELAGLVDEDILSRQYRLHPDFRGETALCWLSYLRDGAQDPLLGKSHARYRPDLHHHGYQHKQPATIHRLPLPLNRPR